MSSIAAGLLGVRDHALYNASKMAVIGMIKAFATDFGKRGITVNGVAPGGIKSDMFTSNAWVSFLSLYNLSHRPYADRLLALHPGRYTRVAC
jgi:NAD(P)-dependent dehydrogenase (short-subunit alcohol dehydrogenase family)